MNQLPFSSLNYGTCTELEGRLFIKALLEVSIHGLGKFGKTSIFPCGIFQYKKGINDKEGTPNYDLKRLALRSTAKRLYPNYANCDWSNQVSWKNQDIATKTKVINSLTDEDKAKLIQRLNSDKSLAEDLCLIVVNGNIIVDKTEKPTEIFSTMGKCKLQPI